MSTNQQSLQFISPSRSGKTSVGHIFPNTEVIIELKCYGQIYRNNGSMDLRIL
jgi:hypothetical protein